jgi:hypothetical protein
MAAHPQLVHRYRTNFFSLFLRSGKKPPAREKGARQPLTHFLPLAQYPNLTVLLPKPGASIHRRFPFASAFFFSISLFDTARKNHFLKGWFVSTENFREKHSDASRLAQEKKAKKIFFTRENFFEIF